MKTTAVNLRNSEFDVYIGRAGNMRTYWTQEGMDGYFGNPFSIGKDGNRDEVIAKYQAYFDKRINEDPEFKSRILKLEGKRLGCFCKPHACHGDVITAYLNKESK